MGFAPHDVAAGVAELLAERGLEARVEHDGARWVFQVRDVVILVGPLPSERETHALFRPRALLALEGDGPLADALKAAIRVKFLRVTG